MESGADSRPANDEPLLRKQQNQPPTLLAVLTISRMRTADYSVSNHVGSDSAPNNFEHKADTHGETASAISCQLPE